MMHTFIAFLPASFSLDHFCQTIVIDARARHLESLIDKVRHNTVHVVYCYYCYSLSLMRCYIVLMCLGFRNFQFNKISSNLHYCNMAARWIVLALAVSCLLLAVQCKKKKKEEDAGLFWPPYSSHLLQSTKAQSKTYCNCIEFFLYYKR